MPSYTARHALRKAKGEELYSIANAMVGFDDVDAKLPYSNATQPAQNAGLIWHHPPTGIVQMSDGTAWKPVHTSVVCAIATAADVWVTDAAVRGMAAWTSRRTDTGFTFASTASTITVAAAGLYAIGFEFELATASPGITARSYVDVLIGGAMLYNQKANYRHGLVNGEKNTGGGVTLFLNAGQTVGLETYITNGGSKTTSASLGVYKLAAA